MLSLSEPHILNLKPYVPGKSIKETKNEYGLKKIIKLASNENPIGPSPNAIKAANKAILNINLYPISERLPLKEKICKKHFKYNIKTNNIVLGNGINELIVLMVRSFMSKNEILLNAWPSFMVYRLAAKINKNKEISVPLTSNLDYNLPKMSELANLKNIKMIFIANPNNPTGKYINTDDLYKFSRNIPKHIILAIDEAYFDYVDKQDYSTSLSLILRRPRTAVLRTFSKIYGLAGLRIGYAVCDPNMAQIMHQVRDPFNVNSIAQSAAIAALSDEKHINDSKLLNKKELQRVRKELRLIGLKTIPSVGNFILMHLENSNINVDNIINKLMRKGIIIRPLKNYDLLNSARISIGSEEENNLLIKNLNEIMKNT